MLDFHRLHLSQREQYNAIVSSLEERSCEYSFANLYLWGRQQVVFRGDCAAFFSHFNGKSIYPYPIGSGDKRSLVAEAIRDAQERGIPCRFSSMTEQDCRELEGWYPGKFFFRPDRDGFDYVYDIHALADLKGKKLQKKRNHLNRFRAEHPEARVLPLDSGNLDMAREMVEQWYQNRMRNDPDRDYCLERLAMRRAFQKYEGLGMEGIALLEGERCIAVTMGTRLSESTFNTHFEKAREDVDGAYTAVNAAFAGYLREKFPELLYINREDDMGIEGLRRAKSSYHPHHMMEKYIADAKEEFYDDPEA